MSRLFEPAHEIMVYRIGEQRRLSRTYKVWKWTDQKSDVQPQWIAAHAYLKIEFTEGDK